MSILIIISNNKERCQLTSLVLSFQLEPCVNSAYCLDPCMLILIIIPNNKKKCLLTYVVLSFRLEPCVNSAYCLHPCMLILIIIPNNKEKCQMTYAVLSFQFEPCVNFTYCLDAYMFILIIIPNNEKCQLTSVVLTFQLETSVGILHIFLILMIMLFLNIFKGYFHKPRRLIFLRSTQHYILNFKALDYCKTCAIHLYSYLFHVSQTSVSVSSLYVGLPWLLSGLRHSHLLLRYLPPLPGFPSQPG